MTLIQTLFDTFFSGKHTVTMEKHPEAKTDRPHAKKDKVSKYSGDVIALEKRFGVLDNRNIDIELQDLLVIAPRNRKRADSYHGLVGYLKRERHTTLTIKTKRKP